MKEGKLWGYIQPLRERGGGQSSGWKHDGVAAKGYVASIPAAAIVTWAWARGRAARMQADRGLHVETQPCPLGKQLRPEWLSRHVAQAHVPCSQKVPQTWAPRVPPGPQCPGAVTNVSFLKEGLT